MLPILAMNLAVEQARSQSSEVEEHGDELLDCKRLLYEWFPKLLRIAAYRPTVGVQNEACRCPVSWTHPCS